MQSNGRARGSLSVVFSILRLPVSVSILSTSSGDAMLLSGKVK